MSRGDRSPALDEGHSLSSGAPGPPGGSQAALVERYTRVVLAQPGASFPLERLAQLYRERDGSLARAIADIDARASGPAADAYAATVALAGLYKLEGRFDDAVAAYERAIARKPDDASAPLALAHLFEDRGDAGAARTRYEQALPRQTGAADREQTLRALMGLALGAQDWPAAKAFHTQLVRLEPTNIFVRGELGRELFNRGEYARAEVEYEELVASATGDNRALAPALKELGRAQAKGHENGAALATLRRALAAAGGQTALRTEIYAIVAEVYRADQGLPALVKEIEDEHPADPARLALLGSLYEEVGDTGKAIESYGRALAIDPRQIDLRLRRVRLLQANGDLDRAIVEYEALIRAAPGNPQFVFEESEALLQRGDRGRALKLVTALEDRSAGDDEVMSRIADFYGRIGEGERSLRVLQRLAGGSAVDPGHLVDLGDHYFQDGNTQLAVQTWKRILTVVQPRAKALATLADVYLDHDMNSDAVGAYREAGQLEPTNLTLKKALAAAYERTHAYREARGIYEEVVARAKQAGDRALGRECRTRIVSLWGLERILDPQIPALRQQFSTTPPDVEAGRMLAEALVHLRRLPEAEDTLRRVTQLEPGDTESHLALERTLVQEGKIADAIVVLGHLAEIDPKRARELYQRMAQYAVQIYRDDDAIRYAARSVELNPDDAEGHKRLGEMYRSKQDTDRAITEFRAAIAKNEHLFVVYFELADLLLSKGETDEADRLFRRVVRGAPDEELIARAARLSTQINLGRGTLESLEQDLLPLAIGNPQRPIYRRLLVEIYGSLTFGLVQRVRHGTTDESSQARAALARIGARAVKPLLDALADPDGGQQRIAIDVLSYVQNRNAALPLFAFANGAADVALRARAMQACGALADGALVPRYEALLFPTRTDGDVSSLADPVGVAAVWGLARMNDARALPLLRRVAMTAGPAMRALAVLGIGMARDARSAADIARLAGSADAGTIAQAAAAYALGDLNAQEHATTLLELAADAEPLARRMALLALASLVVGSDHPPAWRNAAVQAMADALFASDDESVRASERTAPTVAETAARALTIVASGPAARHRGARSLESLPESDGALDVEALLDGLAPQGQSDADRESAAVQFAGPIQRAAAAALKASSARALAVLDALGDGDGELLPMVRRDAPAGVRKAMRAVAAAVEPSVVLLVRHPDVGIRTRALVLVARSSSDAATDAVVAGLQDASDDVRRVALNAVCSARDDGSRAPASERTAAAVGHLASTDASWAMRVLGAQALGRMGAAGYGDAAPQLAAVALRDEYALVRGAALDALASFDRASAVLLARSLADTDPEPRVREAASAILGRPDARPVRP